MPRYVTESGAVFNDYADPEGRVNDPERIECLDQHLRAARAAIDAGVDLPGYFVWSLLEANAHWYRDVIRANGLPPAPTGTLAGAPGSA